MPGTEWKMWNGCHHSRKHPFKAQAKRSKPHVKIPLWRPRLKCPTAQAIVIVSTNSQVAGPLGRLGLQTGLLSGVELRRLEGAPLDDTLIA